MKKISYLIIALFLFHTSVFCQSSLYSFSYIENPLRIITLKYNQTNCSYDTISRSLGLQNDCNISAFYGRGVTSTCDYFIFGYWCPPNDSTILFLGLNQDTAFTINYTFPLRFNIEVEYNPSDNCLYILGSVLSIGNSVEVYKCNLTTGLTNLLTTLPSKYGYGGGGSRFNMSDIDIDSNIMYCGSYNKIAKINLTSGIVDSLYPYLDDSTTCYHNFGLFFDQNSRRILSVSSYPNIEADSYLISYNPITNEKNVIAHTVSSSEESDFAYDDENDIYLIIGDKYYYYSSINGALIDSCPLNNNDDFYHFYPKCYNSTGIEEKTQPQNIKVYPTIANDCLFLELANNTLEISYNIFDNTGRKISSGKEGNIISTLIKIKLPELVPGYYFIQVGIEKALETFKFFKLNTD